MTDFIYEDAFDPDVNIKVIGVGGGGGNALNCMASSDVKDWCKAHKGSRRRKQAGSRPAERRRKQR